MKKLFLLGAVGALLSISACTTTGSAPTPAQVAAALCTPTETAVNTITDLATANPGSAPVQKASADLAKIQPTIAAACTSLSTVTSNSVQALITQGLPALGTILGTLPLPAQQIATLESDFTLAEISINMLDVIVTNINNAKAQADATAPASSALGS